jgi:hypothetical protein
MKLVFLVLGSAAAALLLTACHTKSAAAGEDASSASASASTALDPAVLALLAPAESCKLEDGRFQACAAADAFRHSDASALAGEKGDAVLLTLLTSTNERHRLLAASRPMVAAPRLLATKDNAERLFAQLERETNADVRDYLLERAGEIDVEKLGFFDRLKALAASKDPAVRRAVAGKLLFHEGQPVREEIVGRLLKDPDQNVRRSAAGALFAAAMSGHSDARSACAPLADALDGDHRDDVFVRAASAPRCPGLQQKALAYLEAKTAKPEALTNDAGISCGLAVAAVCDGKDANLRVRAYDVAVRLTGSAVDPATRVSGTRHLGDCDPVRAKIALAKLTTDKDASVAAEAKTALEKLTAAK